MMDELNIFQRVVFRTVVLRIAETIEKKHRRPPEMTTLFKIVEAFMADNPHVHWQCVDWASCWKPGINIFEYSRRLKKKYPTCTWRYAYPLPIDEIEIYWEEDSLGVGGGGEESEESLEKIIDRWFNLRRDRVSGWRAIIFELIRKYLTLIARLTSRMLSLLGET